MNAQSPLLTRWRDVCEMSSSVVTSADERKTLREIYEQSRRVAATLTPSGESLGGERIGVWLGPSASFVATLFGIWMAGGTGLVLTELYPIEERRALLEEAKVRRVMSRTPLPWLPEGLETLSPDASVEPLTATPAYVAHSPALELFTSGTTARPKGALLSHENLAVQTALLREAWAIREQDLLLHTLPLHHMHGLAIALLSAVLAGASVMFMPFQASQVWTTIADPTLGVTMFMGVPTMYAKLISAWDEAGPEQRGAWQEGARRLRLATSGSAALPAPLAERWRDIAGNIPLERFGMTEVGVALTNPLLGERLAGHVGFPLPSVEARIVDDAGRDAEVGELWLRGPSVFLGYDHQPEATREAFSNGWFRTGDTVSRHDSGSFRVLGRSSVDIIKSGGYKLSALEIEEVLLRMPSIAEAAVIGVPDPVWGELVVACIVHAAETERDLCPGFDQLLSLDAEGTADGPPGPERYVEESRTRPSHQQFRELILSHVRRHMAAYKAPRELVFLRQLPRNALGKVQKKPLAAALTRWLARWLARA